MKIFLKYILTVITVSNVNEQVLQASVIKNEQGAKTCRY